MQPHAHRFGNDAYIGVLYRIDDTPVQGNVGYEAAPIVVFIGIADLVGRNGDYARFRSGGLFCLLQRAGRSTGCEIDECRDWGGLGGGMLRFGSEDD